jgi:hypothetical protein
VSPVSPYSTRGKPVYPSMRKIPGDFPCHERYVTLEKSRSTKAPEVQKVWPVSWIAGDDKFATEEEVRSVRSSLSSVYSQDDASETSLDWEYKHPR